MSLHHPPLLTFEESLASGARLHLRQQDALRHAARALATGIDDEDVATIVDAYLRRMSEAEIRRGPRRATTVVPPGQTTVADHLAAEQRFCQAVCRTRQWKAERSYGPQRAVRTERRKPSGAQVSLRRGTEALAAAVAETFGVTLTSARLFADAALRDALPARQRERLEGEAVTGHKDDAGKARHDLIPAVPLDELFTLRCRVSTHAVVIPVRLAVDLGEAVDAGVLGQRLKLIRLLDGERGEYLAALIREPTAANAAAVLGEIETVELVQQQVLNARVGQPCSDLCSVVVQRVQAQQSQQCGAGVLRVAASAEPVGEEDAQLLAGHGGSLYAAFRP